MAAVFGMGSVCADPSIETIGQAVASIDLVQAIHDRCRRDGHVLESGVYRRWYDRNRIEALTPYLDRQMAENSQLADKQHGIEQLVDRQVNSMVPAACLQFSRALQLEELNPLQRFPALRDALPAGKGSGRGRGSARASEQSSPPSDQPEDDRYNAEHAQAMTEAIDSVVFDYLPRGGEFAIVPVLLFEDGRACTDMALLTNYASERQHRSEHPLRWRQWRQQGGRVQIKGEGDWEDVQYQRRYHGFPEDYRFEHRYKRLNSISGGGGDFAMASRHFEFYRDGTFISGQSAFANSENSMTGAQASVASLPEDQTGQYHVDGFILTLEYDNGDVVRKAIVTDDLDDPEVIWINGYDYVSY